MYVDGSSVQQFTAGVCGGGQQPALVVRETVRQEQHRSLITAALAPGLCHFF